MSNDILTNLLISCGIRVIPKSDGRVEVPQSLVRALGWNRQQTIYLYSNPGELFLTNKKEKGIIGKIQVSYGRIRIPIKILKIVNFYKKIIVLLLNNNSIVARISYKDDENLIKYIINKAEGLDDLFSILLGQFQKPKLFLLQDNFVARIIKPPFKFPGFILSTGELVIIKKFTISKHPYNFYLLPIIKLLNSREKYDFGYLLLNEDVYGIVLGTIRRLYLDSRKLDRSFIFLYCPFSNGMWNVYANPPDNIPEDIIQIGIRMCNYSELFLNSFFREFKKGDIEYIIDSNCLSILKK